MQQVPGDIVEASTPEKPTIETRNVKAIFFRYYRELYQYCDDCDAIYWRWGKIAVQGGENQSTGTTNNSGTGTAHVISSGTFTISVDTPFGKVPIPGLQISGGFKVGETPNWTGSKSIGVTPIAPTNSNDSLPDPPYQLSPPINCKTSQRLPPRHFRLGPRCDA